MVYEVVSRGLLPYSHIKTNLQVAEEKVILRIIFYINFQYLTFQQFVVQGGRIEKPDDTDSSLWSSCQQMWATNPSERPNFAEILLQFEDIQSKYDDYLKTVPEDTCYLQPVDSWGHGVHWSLKNQMSNLSIKLFTRTVFILFIETKASILVPIANWQFMQ